MSSIVALGSALLDIEYRGDASALAAAGLRPKDAVMVQAQEQAHRRALLDSSLAAPTLHAGGSVANSLTVSALAGHNCTLISLVGSDEEAERYISSLDHSGVQLAGSRSPSGATGSCLVLVTPDGERAMSSFLGVSGEITASWLEPAPIAAADWLLLEGYFLASENTFQTLLAAYDAAVKARTRVALTLSSAALVEQHWPRLEQLLDRGVDLLLGNESEAVAALRKGVSAEEAVGLLLSCARMVAITVSERGVLLGSAQERWHIPTERVQVSSTLGAGDAFAGAFLAAIAQGLTLPAAGRLGCKAGTAQVQTAGPRLSEEGRQTVRRAFEGHDG